jgi:hypothetical protein
MPWQHQEGRALIEAYVVEQVRDAGRHDLCAPNV